MTRIAIDIGGTKIALAGVDAEGHLHAGSEVRIPTATAELWSAVQAAMTSLGGESISAVGISAAGPIDLAAGTIAPLNIPEWRGGFSVVSHALAAAPGASVQLIMDGSAAALAEYHLGAGIGTHGNLLGIIVSTGVGGGIILGGKVIAGQTGNAGHIGHVFIGDAVPDGATALCGCGASGCLEAIASGPAAVRWALAHGWAPKPAAATGEDLAAAARVGNPVAAAALDRAGTAIGIAVASAASLLDVDTVAIGGGFAQAGPALWDPLQRAFREHARLGFLREVTVVPSPLGATASLAGAGLMCAPGDLGSEVSEPH